MRATDFLAICVGLICIYRAQLRELLDSRMFKTTFKDLNLWFQTYEQMKNWMNLKSYDVL
jgi:hypothetical protein